MKTQSDWFTGIDYYDQYQEKDITAELVSIDHEIELHRHVQVELWYILEGDAVITINGTQYPMQKHSFICMYAHHLYSVSHIKQTVKAYVVRFYIGVFMHMMWEKHEKGINAQLVYDTCPYLYCNQDEVEQIMKKLYDEYVQQRFGSKNMMLYLALQAHTLYCRMALELEEKPKEEQIWKHIKRIIVSAEQSHTIENTAKETGYHPQYLNQLVKKKSGYTFQDLVHFGKVINACALLHFEDLSVSYIADLLHFDSKASFYRIFEQYTKMTPSAYRLSRIYPTTLYKHQDLYLQIQQYLHLHFFQNLQVHQIAQALHVKPYAVTHILKTEYNTTLTKELQRIRIQYACALLLATDATMTHIAMDCGFESVATFQRAFRSQLGCTCTEYRNLSN